MEYPHQQYVEQTRHNAQQRREQQRVYQPMPYTHQAGTGDAGAPLGAPVPSPQELAIRNFQALAQCRPEEARYYLEVWSSAFSCLPIGVMAHHRMLPQSHNFDLHQAMAARASDMEWERQHPSHRSQQSLQLQPQQVDSNRPLGDGEVLAQQIQEARERMRRRYEQQSGKAYLRISPQRFRFTLLVHSTH